MIVKTIEHIGSKTLRYYLKMINFFSFFFTLTLYFINPFSYSQIDSKLFYEQIYFSTIKALYFFLLIAIGLGSFVIIAAITFSINYNIQSNIGELLVSFIVNEFSPVFTVLFILYVHGLRLDQAFSCKDIDNNLRYKKIYLPILLSGVISSLSMALLFATIMLGSGFLVSSFYLNIDLNTYRSMITSNLEVNNLIVLMAKASFLGYFTTMILLYYKNKFKRSPYKLDRLNFTVKILGILFFTIVTIEILFLLIVY